MAYPRPLDTDERAVPAALRTFLRHRLQEMAGLALLGSVVAASAALASWSVADPSWSHAVDGEPGNLLGYPGAVVADELIRAFGLAVAVPVSLPLFWSARLFSHRPLNRPIRRIAGLVVAAVSASALLSLFEPPAGWVLGARLGGAAGDVAAYALLWLLSFAMVETAGFLLAGLLCFIATLAAIMAALDISGDDLLSTTDFLGPRIQDRIVRTAGFVSHTAMRIGSIMPWRRPRPAGKCGPKSAHRPGVLARLKGALAAMLRPRSTTRRPLAPVSDPHDRIEPRLGHGAAAGKRRQKNAASPSVAGAAMDLLEDDAGYSVALDEFDPPFGPDALEDDERDGSAPVIPIERPAGPLRPATAATRPSRKPKITYGSDAKTYEMPPLSLLTEPKRQSRPSDLTDEALQANARMLEGVLEDFGVRGAIIHVRPGPVVTLYELEPAPGIKSSRVIGLADDIARSMSAVSARVAVVPGRNVIGIELPNSRRETVFLRELFACDAYEKSGQHLAFALGKNIGGEPVFADLARMPHLLIAGTTGSGKSVGINTMILSLLYRLTPEQCKLIMIDPKMLELSVYEGIPHLLSPVVTDPRKAVVALKWAVREMEDRYRKMSKLGVRNIDGYNTRVRQALAKGEGLTRTVQVGYDPESGEPLFEREAMDIAPLPFIVVIIDEMADLMMVAGKDIEGAVQRLAQMARAAGIHVVMATQRPSVDVITGTIKANFPTRISFQVTSKIDSRTILGEQGAEQLLGQGDMLYMAGGGRITRLHGAFVSDGEVETIVAHLKEQGIPDYVEAVTEEPDEDGAGGGDSPFDAGSGAESSGDDLYDQAVAVVLRDKKVSTSYIQRRLQVGYNKAASLIERMEKDGVISSPNHQGKREILAGGEAV